MGEGGGGQRIDKWLFFARLAKSRSLAQKIVAAGAVRVNREKTTNVARQIRPGDVLTLSIHGRVRVLKVVDGGARRGPAPEAALLFEDLAPPARRDGELSGLPDSDPSGEEHGDEEAGEDEDDAPAGPPG